MSGQAAFDKPVRPAALCRVGAAGKKEVGRCEEIELNGVGEERDDMSDGEGDKFDDEEGLAAPDWRVRAGPRNKPTQREREEHEATRVPFRDWCTLHDGKGSHPSSNCKAERVKMSPGGPSLPWIISS